MLGLLTFGCILLYNKKTYLFGLCELSHKVKIGLVSPSYQNPNRSIYKSPTQIPVQQDKIPLPADPPCKNIVDCNNLDLRI